MFGCQSQFRNSKMAGRSCFIARRSKRTRETGLVDWHSECFGGELVTFGRCVKMRGSNIDGH